MTRITYLTTARMPTEKAHGHQIAQMCAALDQAGATVELRHPGRGFRPSSELYDYYRVPRAFADRPVPATDPVKILKRRGRARPPAAYVLRDLIWAWHALADAPRTEDAVIFTREPELAAVALLRGRPTVLEVHRIPEGSRRHLLRWVSRHRNTRLVIPITSFMAGDLVGMGVPEQRVVTLPDAVDLGRFVGLPPRATARRRVGLPPDAFVVGYVGRFRSLDGEKGLPQLIGAVARLPSEIDPLLVCVGGPMDAADDYRAIASREGLTADRLRLVDRVPPDEVPRWMRACDVVTIPWPWSPYAAYQTSPMKLYEYMASGTPIVASDLPSLRVELEDGRNAVLVEPGDPDALARGLLRARDPRTGARLAEAADADVQPHSWVERARAVVARLDASD